jgi:hypothetical protein
MPQSKYTCITLMDESCSCILIKKGRCVRQRLNFMLGWPCIIFSFTLFSFQLDTLTILYIYNLRSFIYLYMFRTDRSIIRRSNAFIAQAASGTVSLVVVCLGRPLVLDSNTNGRPRQTTTKETVPEAACAIKAFDLLMMDRSVRNM